MQFGALPIPPVPKGPPIASDCSSTDRLEAMAGLQWNPGVNSSRYWFTVREDAQYTGIDEETIRREIRDGNLHTRRLDVNVVIVDAELERWVRVRRPSHAQAARRSQMDPKAPRPFSVEDWLDQTDG